MWNKDNLERLRMDHPYAAISELVAMMNDEAIQAAYMPIKTSMAIESNTPVTGREERVRAQATSLRQKREILSAKPVRKEVQKKYTADQRSANPQKQIHREREQETVHNMLHRIRAAGPKSVGQAIAEELSKGLVRVRIPGGVAFVRPDQVKHYQAAMAAEEKKFAQKLLEKEGPFYRR